MGVGKQVVRLMAALLILAASAGSSLAAREGLSVPDSLVPWEGWVLYGHEDRTCPRLGGTAQGQVCLFPSRLSLRLERDGASFELRARLFSRQAVRLPFAENAWPASVKVDGQTAAVAEKDGAPAVYLEAGEHVLTGVLSFASRPEFLRLAPDTGLVELVRDGKPVAFPDLAPDGRLRLEREETAAAPEDRLEVRVFRLFHDAIPGRLTTLARLEVSGMARRVSLAGLLPPDSEPMEVRSPAPLSFGPGGTVNVQVGPGRYDIEIQSRLNGPVAALGPEKCPYGPEIWAFRAERDLREVEVRGLPGVDPRTTDLPEAWKAYPAFLVEPGAKAELHETHRGEAGARLDELAVDRDIWLDFDGAGLSVRDVITGANRSGWTLAMLAPGAPGRVSLQGRDSPIVLLGPDKLPGVEVRDANVNVAAESRYEHFAGVFPAAGWDRDFKTASATLNLPPGWRLLGAAGVDTAENSWIGRWNLLNIFLTLVLSLAVFKLRGLPACLAVFGFLALSWHEAGAPTEEWIAVVISLALLSAASGSGRLLPGGFIGRLLTILYAGSVLVLALVSAGFIFSQLRYGMYPQLEPVPYFESASLRKAAGRPAPASAKQEQARAKMALPLAEAPAPEPEMALMAPPPPPAPGERAAVNDRAAGAGSYGASAPEKTILRSDPYALVQTGPGMPDWSWRGAKLSWNGPVAVGQTVTLYLVSPGVNLLLAVVRTVLLLAAFFLTLDPRRLKGLKESVTRAGPTAAVLLLALLLAAPALARAADYPPRETLDELRERLLAPEPCFPDCAASPAVDVRLDASGLTLVFGVDAAAPVVVPLPRVSDRWQPANVVLDDGARPALIRDGGALRVLVPKGAHRVVVSGPVPEGVSFEIGFPVTPKKGTVNAPGWSVMGLSPDGTLEGALKLARTEVGGGAAQQRETYRIAPFLEVRRSLTLGLTWEIETQAVRLTPLGEPVVAEIPLLPGESVVAEKIEVRNGRVLVNMKPDQARASWRSRLEIADVVRLEAPSGVPFVETWTLEAAPIWNVVPEGIPAVRTLTGRGVWSPQWRPWPGEVLTLAVSRPEAAPGPSLTVDAVRRTADVGERQTENTLVVNYRASKGERRAIGLPEGARVSDVAVDGRTVPWTGVGKDEIAWPVSPGGHELKVVWREEAGAATTVEASAVDLKTPAANVTTVLNLPKDRWLLRVFGRSLQGPAVLFWSYLAGIVVISLGLGFVPWTPLKRWQWLLFGLGLTQVDPLTAFFAAAWLAALGLRRDYPVQKGWFVFNSLQVLLVILVLCGFGALYDAIETGLLGLPRMQVAGNGSTAASLVWTMDRLDGVLPRPGAVSIPLYWYRAVMLAWSLWLAWSLLSWLKWGYGCFGREGLWRKAVFPRRSPRWERRPEEAKVWFPKKDKASEEAASGAAGSGSGEPAGPGAPDPGDSGNGS